MEHFINPRTRFRALAACLAGLVLFTSCVGGGGSKSTGPGSGFANLQLEQAYWGRLVDVFDEAGNAVENDVVVRSGLISDAVDYTLAINPVTQSESLTIHAPALNNNGEKGERFTTLLDAARSGLFSIRSMGMDDNGTYTKVARNGVVKLVFSEYLDPETVNNLTLQLWVNDQVANVRYVVKKEEDTLGEPKGIVLLDPTISAFDSAQLFIPQNGIGFAESPDQINENAILRIPTALEPSYGQTQVLSNQNGTRHLSPSASDPTELSMGLSDVVIRAFRTGNRNDQANGFMQDRQLPNLQADLNVRIHKTSLHDGLHRMSYQIEAEGCRGVQAKVGDVIQFNGAILLVSEIISGGSEGLIKVAGSLIDGDLEIGDHSSNPLRGEVSTVYSHADRDFQWCWVRFDPQPAELPATGVDPFATARLKFSEPMDPRTLLSMETMVLHSFSASSSKVGLHAGYSAEVETVGGFIERLLGYTQEDDPSTSPVENGSGRILFGPISVSSDSRSFTLASASGMADSFEEGADLRFGLAVRDGVQGPLDLAGNPLNLSGFVAGQPGTAALSLSTDPPNNRYFALRFQSLDENNDGLAEYTGQVNWNDGALHGRDVLRFSRQADPSANLYLANRAAFKKVGVSTPLSPAGAVLMTTYGYHHLGLGVAGPAEYNLDVEGLNWSPFDGKVLDDFFPDYSISLAHSNRYPDDYLDSSSGFPVYTKSGLRRVKEFDDNILGFNEGNYGIDEKEVFRSEYRILASNTFISDSGMVYSPWPDFDDSYTWRDTSFPEDITGGPGPGNEYGVPIAITGQSPIYKPGEWPSIVAPLLLRFRSYPRGDFFGWNGFQVQIMVPSSNVPAFRVFSYGGNGRELVVPDKPEAGTKPTGGAAFGGGVQRGYGPEMYWSQMDFVVKVTRTFSHWFAFGGKLDSVSAMVLEPDTQPIGTNLVVDWRATEELDISSCKDPFGLEKDQLNPLVDAVSQLDAYGEYVASNISQDRLTNPPPISEYCATLSTPSDWTENVAYLANERKWNFFQLRMTFVSNTETEQTPSLDAYGFSWTVEQN